jgi:lactate permease
MWVQNYNPCRNSVLSTFTAAFPAIALFTSIAVFRIRIHLAALLALTLALIVSVGIYRMPASIAGASCLFGVAFGLFPISWLLLNVIFIHQLTVKCGLFDVLRQSLSSVAPDPRIQVILIAFGFGSFLEAVAGFGAPVAICAAILIQLGFKPLHATGLALIANTAPVAFGGLGLPITTLEQVTGISVKLLAAMTGRQLVCFAAIIPCWVVVAFAGWRGLRGVWPAAVTAGVAFAIPEYLISNFHGPWLVGTVSGLSTIISLVVLLRFWKPKVPWRFDAEGNPGPVTEIPKPAPHGHPDTPHLSGEPKTIATLAVTEVSDPVPESPQPNQPSVFRAWLPWMVLTAFILIWGMPPVMNALDKIASPAIPAPYLHHMVQRVPPVVPANAKPEPAIFKLNFLSSIGTGVFFSAIIGGLLMGFSIPQLAANYLRTLWSIRLSLLTIATMLALGNVTKYSGTDATLGLALAHTGTFYPFFGTLLGWFGVAMTGSDTSSNVLFGSLQKITANQLGINPVLMTSANSAGGVMGKMLAAQSIVIASTATNWYGHEARIIKFVFLHSLALVTLMGILVYLQAYIPPFIYMVPK